MLNPNPSPPADPDVLTRFQEELAKATALPGLAPASAAAWPRFAGYYQGLARLPRKARRALLLWRRSLGGLALLCTLGQAPAQGTEPSVIDLRGVETLGIGTSPSKAATAKAGQDLLALHTEYQAHLGEARGQGFRSSNTVAPVSGGSVVIDAAASGDPEALATDLRALGANNVTVFGRMVSGLLPITAIPALKDLSSLQFARPAYAAIHVGNVTSQGDAAMLADIGRTAVGVDGTGVTVGAMSDSYNCRGGAAAGVASGDLPPGVNVLEEGPCPGSDEARALVEVIHDVAPGAAIAVHTAFKGQANFAQGIIDLANAGAKVITDDVIYFAEPFFQDGIIAQAVDTVKGRGVSYFSSAGNQARDSYEAPFRFSGQFFDIGFGAQEAHDFDPGAGVDICQQVTIPVGGLLILDYQWDEPFFSVSGAPGSSGDLDIVLTNAACDTALAVSAAANIGSDPFEIFGIDNGGPATTFGVIILRFRGPPPGLMKTVLFGNGSIDAFDTKSGTSWGHSAAVGALGVGAADYQDTPEFGQDPPRIESFSSAGGSPILFGITGNRLATPEVRQQPDITAPDGVDTTFFGFDRDGNGFPNFFGTSASAPHAAGVAALMKDLVPDLTPDAIYAALKTTAIDMDDPTTPGFDAGFDTGTGFGLIQADAALGAVEPLPPPPRISTASVLPSGVSGQAYTPATLVATGGKAPLRWSGIPSAGLTLSQSGVISGTPAVAGTTDFTVTVVDSARTPRSDTRSFRITIAIAPTIEQPVEATPVTANPPVPCTGTQCRVALRCELTEGQCSTNVSVFVRTKVLKSPNGTERRRKFAKFCGGAANWPAGQDVVVKMKPSRKGKAFIKATKASKKHRTIRGMMQITNSAGTFSSMVPVKIKL